MSTHGSKLIVSVISLKATLFQFSTLNCFLNFKALMIYEMAKAMLALDAYQNYSYPHVSSDFEHRPVVSALPTLVNTLEF